MGKKRLGAVAICAAAVVGVSAGGALAGDITGTGKYIAGSDAAPLNGKSICAYSGLNDDRYIDGDQSAPRTQSWGQIARYAQGALGGVPGVACRGN